MFSLLYGVDKRSLSSHNDLLGITEGFPSGQRDQTVNLTAPPSEVQILPPPPVNESSEYRIVRGCSLMVELQPSKLTTWVRFPSPAPYWLTDLPIRVAVNGRPKSVAHIAQSVEHFLGKEEVTGSNPVMGSIASYMFSV